MRTTTLALVGLATSISAFPFPWTSLRRTSDSGFIAADELNILAPVRVGIYICQNADWVGPCEHLLNGPGMCINLSDQLAGEVSSVGPDPEASGCTLFEEENCKGDQIVGLKTPGESNLGLSPQAGRFNDVFRSYICY
ncbi:unnamed protein product [Zymoseptoria tritici ST99CH_1A5]|uniref:Uncharacterized protein n=4 Tax=Zymoseptoria tritici TaxID=1047171 RepID=F9XE83_ZYMTI|nr:uncharacterized protein MYCGRDRAFT_94117 [Zymoseptoria tritici IPO323]SMQ52019.1 unnamed protein product [Zymoseptoria tritici ST99CH_3D7]SMR54630.1 unnamed protein product [Zymoseptoria tritici ST99CH_1E4]SMR56469.1 unnamed protein product [Zymoseptoria tritici ST99CH_3D1]SMY25665.1 unnamed protein product [Zymoseptoria tritici ST99CH_1A5]EGP86693.1 hypothetical protein MYCGRDRAFT_94117 [Zymoseptoria tritici IPO323]